MKKNSLLGLCAILAYVLTTSCEREIDTVTPIKISSDTLVFTDNQTNTLLLSAEQSYEFTVISYPSWLTVFPLSGKISNKITEITLVSYFGALPKGGYEGYLVFSTSLGKDSIYLKGFVGEHTLYSVAKTVYIDYSANKEIFTLSNIGNTSIQYAFDIDSNFISLSPKMGKLEAGQATEVLIQVDRKFLQKGLTKANLYLNINQKRTDTITVSINHYKEQKKRLYCERIVDAEYNKQQDILVFVTQNPDRLYIYETVKNRFDSIDLPEVPRCVSIAPNGHVAVVGHENDFSYFDLASMKNFGKKHVRDASISDIIITDNHWVYVFPETYSSNSGIIMNTESNTYISKYCGLYPGAVVRLDNSGKYYYGTDESSNIVKLEFHADTIKILKRYSVSEFIQVSAFDNYIPDDLWISEKGDMIYTSRNYVFNVVGNDFFYKGKIALDSAHQFIKWLVKPSTQNNIYAIIANYMQIDYKDSSFISSYLYVIDETTLRTKNKIALENYLIKNITTGQFGVLYCEPNYLFCNSKGDKLFVLSRAFSLKNLNIWGIEEISLNNTRSNE
ncbi:MAG: hypothetical protein WHT29_01405 [Bacteroidales bacterium]